MNELKAGDRVVITDGSYTRSIINGKLVREFLNHGNAKGKPYTVVEVGCSFPLYDELQPDKYRNDTVVQDDNGKVVFIHHQFLALANYTITIDGKDIEISCTSFVELKRSLGVS